MLLLFAAIGCAAIGGGCLPSTAEIVADCARHNPTDDAKAKRCVERSLLIRDSIAIKIARAAAGLG